LAEKVFELTDATRRPRTSEDTCPCLRRANNTTAVALKGNSKTSFQTRFLKLVPNLPKAVDRHNGNDSENSFFEPVQNNFPIAATLTPRQAAARVS
jgi:hypothetical protein